MATFLNNTGLIQHNVIPVWFHLINIDLTMRKLLDKSPNASNQWSTIIKHSQRGERNVRQIPTTVLYCTVRTTVVYVIQYTTVRVYFKERRWTFFCLGWVIDPQPWYNASKQKLSVDQKSTWCTSTYVYTFCRNINISDPLRPALPRLHWVNSWHYINQITFYFSHVYGL